MWTFIGIAAYVIVLARLWDSSRRKWELTKKEKYDSLWHIWSYLFQASFIGYVFWKEGMDPFLILYYGPIGLATLWILLDMFWAWDNGFHLLYIGDGKGALIERFVKKISLRLKVNRSKLTWGLKLGFLGVSILWGIVTLIWLQN